MTQTVHALMHSLGQRARAAHAQLARSTTAQKREALTAAAQSIRAKTKNILQANAKDMTAARAAKLSPALLDRLELSTDRIEAMAKGLEAIAELPNPVGRILEETTRPNGMKISKISVPLGVIGIIYESRPNVTADAGALCLMSGNAAILRGGSDSIHSSQAIMECLHIGLEKAGLPIDTIQLVSTTDRTAVGEMLKMVGVIDVIIPRGGKSLTERVAKESRIPTILHLDGNCHTYLHAAADPVMAKEIVLNAKLRRAGVCGATESLLVDATIAQMILPPILDTLISQGCEIRGDAKVQALDIRVKPANEDDWGTEYLDKILSIKTVENEEEAIDHINRHGSHHTDAIVTGDKKTAEKFLNEIDSAIVLHNASTQFADGGEFGMGAEIGISTGRLHARGPVGVAELTTYKYIIHGSGQIRP